MCSTLFIEKTPFFSDTAVGHFMVLFLTEHHHLVVRDRLSCKINHLKMHWLGKCNFFKLKKHILAIGICLYKNIFESSYIVSICFITITVYCIKMYLEAVTSVVSFVLNYMFYYLYLSRDHRNFKSKHRPFTFTAFTCMHLIGQITD